MIIEELLMYLEVAFTTFVVNIVPIFAPPTWIVLCLFKVNRLELNTLWVAFLSHRLCGWKICDV